MATFLRRFPAFRTTNLEEYEGWMRSSFNMPLLDVRLDDSGFECAFNHVVLPSVTLTYARYRSQVTANIRLEGFNQGFCLAGAGEAQWSRHDWTIAPGRSNVGGPGSGGLVTYGAGYTQLIQTLSPAILTRKLSAMIGEPVDPPLQVTGRAADPDRVAAQLRLIRFLSDELDRTAGAMPPIVLSEIEQAIIVAFLTSHDHNYGKWLDGTPRAAAPWQVRRAVDYIREHWDRAISIEDLVADTGATARSLFYLFNKTHGLSPIAYANRLRLQHARARLSRPEAGTSVTTVCFDCGFSNPGHFAKKYFSAFGELPSETLKNSG